jgi:predicted small integral membrane protein
MDSEPRDPTAYAITADNPIPVAIIRFPSPLLLSGIMAWLSQSTCTAPRVFFFEFHSTEGDDYKEVDKRSI